MIRTFKAELVKLRRRRVAVVVTLSALAFAAIAATAVFLSATEAGGRPSERGATLGSLSQAGGATEAFALGASFAGILVLVLFSASACSRARRPRCWSSRRSCWPSQSSSPSRRRSRSPPHRTSRPQTGSASTASVKRPATT